MSAERGLYSESNMSKHDIINLGPDCLDVDPPKFGMIFDLKKSGLWWAWPAPFYASKACPICGASVSAARHRAAVRSQR